VSGGDEMQVRPADRGRGGAQDGIGGLLDPGDRDVVHADVTDAVPNNSPAAAAPELELRLTALAAGSSQDVESSSARRVAAQTGDRPGWEKMMTDAVLVSDAIVARLREWGVHRIFGYAGDGIDPLLAALHRAGGDPELVTVRHEEMAAFMASGHAKYTGEVGVCLSTQGPGAIHLLTGLYDAKLDRKPVVAIVGQVVSTALGSGYLQEVDLQTLFKDVWGSTYRRSPRRSSSRSYSTTRSGRRSPPPARPA
jgi:hypothetical protein